MRRALQTSRDNRYASASAMQTDLEKFLKSATALATSRELGEYVRRELPPTAGGGRGRRRSAQPGGNAAAAAEAADRGAGVGAAADADAAARRFAGAIGGDSEEIPHRRPTAKCRSTCRRCRRTCTSADEPPTNERLLPEKRGLGRSSASHTAVVPPLAHSPLRTYVAALVAGLTVAAVTLFALRPWAAPRIR